MIKKLSNVDQQKLLRLGAFAVLSFYIMMCPLVSMPLYNWMAFGPSGDIADLAQVGAQVKRLTGATGSEVMIDTAHGQKLIAWFFQLPGRHKVFLVSHGSGGTFAAEIVWAVVMLKSGGSVLMYDYEGFGRSTGSKSLERVKEDGQAAYEFLTRNKHYDGKDIIVYGASLGSGVAVDVARHNRVGGLILRSGYTSLVATGKRYVPWLNLYPSFVFDKIEMNNISYLRGAHPPVLLIHGDSDALFLHDAEENYAAASKPKQLFVLRGSTHGNELDPDHSQNLNGILHCVNTFVASIP